MDHWKYNDNKLLSINSKYDVLWSPLAASVIERLHLHEALETRCLGSGSMSNIILHNNGFGGCNKNRQPQKFETVESSLKLGFDIGATFLWRLRENIVGCSQLMMCLSSANTTTRRGFTENHITLFEYGVLFQAS